MTTRRHFLGGLASSAALATGWREETPTTTPPPDRPRVVMLGLDGACSELMRSAVVPTPNYDRLVRESTRLARCYAVFPLCAPARAAFLTALPPQSHGQLNNHFVLHEEMPTAVGQLRDLGLSSYLYGKQHTNNDETEAGGNTWGYDAILTRNSESLGTVKARYEDTDARRGWLDEEDKAVFAEIEGLTGHDFGGRIRPFSADPDWAFLQAGLEQVETLEKQGGRWLVNISLLGPHHPYSMPEEYYFLFDPDEIDTSNIDREGWRRSAPARNLMEHRRWDRLEDRHFQRIIARQQGYVAYMDWMLGQCLGRLEELGLLDTILFAAKSIPPANPGERGQALSDRRRARHATGSSSRTRLTGQPPS
ncbi:MAG TPA: sulfatase-like hydrolase/transferase [Myxococcota bacterium]|nr:sulfatase-like hydrolase/transferase [Myxococcota bacterium]